MYCTRLLDLVRSILRPQQYSSSRLNRRMEYVQNDDNPSIEVFVYRQLRVRSPGLDFGDKNGWEQNVVTTRRALRTYIDVIEQMVHFSSHRYMQRQPLSCTAHTSILWVDVSLLMHPRARHEKRQTLLRVDSRSKRVGTAAELCMYSGCRRTTTRRRWRSGRESWAPTRSSSVRP